jgi:holliday junction DNA helicase RuvB
MAIISSKQFPDEPPPPKQSDLREDSQASEQETTDLSTTTEPPAAPQSAYARAINAGPPAKQSTKILTPEATLAEEKEEGLRPQRLRDYVGQKDLKEVLAIAMGAATARQESLDHLLLYGPPGLGKTTISLILASEMGVNCRITSAPFCSLTKYIAFPG